MTFHTLQNTFMMFGVYRCLASMTKAKISVTISGSLAKEIDQYLRKLVVEAARSGKPIPRQSNIYEEIIARGWEVVKTQAKK